MARFFLDGQRATLLIQLDDAVLFRRTDNVSEDGSAILAGGSFCQHLRQPVPVEDVVAKDEGDRIVSNEIATDDKCIGQTPWGLLFGIGKFQAEIRTAAQKASKERLV